MSWSGGLTLIALALAWLALSAVLADFVNRRLQAEQAAAARAVMAAAGWDAAGRFTVIPPPADPHFERPLSGWYWQVSDGAAVLARAPSLVTGSLGVGGTGTTGPDAAALVAHVERFTAPGDGRPLSVTVTLPAAEVDIELDAIRRPLALSLAVLGTALLAAQGLAVRAGLVDLDTTLHAPVIPVLEDVALVLAPQARHRGVTLICNGADAPDFWGDAEDLAEIVGALAENAVIWARSTVHVTVRAATAPARLSVTIEDDGPGIPEAERTRLMTRGARLDEATPGHGLGLAIAADRVEAYGGDFTLGASESGGLRVDLSLPARV